MSTEYRIVEASFVPEYHVVDKGTLFEEAQFMADELSHSSDHECYLEGYCKVHGWTRCFDGYCEACCDEYNEERIRAQMDHLGIDPARALEMATQSDSVYAIPSIRERDDICWDEV